MTNEVVGELLPSQAELDAMSEREFMRYAKARAATMGIRHYSVTMGHVADRSQEPPFRIIDCPGCSYCAPTNRDCWNCSGLGWEFLDFPDKEICPRCNGTKREPYTLPGGIKDA